MTVRTALDVMNELYGSVFSGPDWDAWRTFLRALYALPMGEADLETYRACTGRQQPPASPTREAWMVVGRRGGKSRIAAFLAVFMAAFRRYTFAPGERGVVMVLAADRRQALVVMRYVFGLLDSHPMTAALITNRRKDGVELSCGVNIEVHTASYRTVRGYTVVAVICDEIAFWSTEDDAADGDADIVNALRPAMLTVPEALLLGLSSPYARRGELYKAYAKHFGQDGAAVLVWQAATRVMHPGVPQALIDEAYAEDDVAAAAEYGAEFRRDIEAFLSREAIAAVVVSDRRELPASRDIRYTAFVDPSGGAHDSMTLAITHRERSGGVVLDAVREVRAPFSPEAAVVEFVATLRAYRVTTVTGDKYAGEWPRERFAKLGVSYRTSDLSKSELYTAFAPLVNGGRCALLDHPVLIRQLQQLERRTARSGKDSIDHPPRGRDDVANAVAGALTLAVERVSRFGFAHVDLDAGPAPGAMIPDGWTAEGYAAYLEDVRGNTAI